MTAWATVKELALDSLYLCGAYAPGEIPDLTYIARAIKLLNVKLDYYSRSSLYIPYASAIDFSLTSNKGSYTFSKTIPADIDSPMFATIETCILRYQNTEYPVRIIDQKQIDYHYRSTNQTGRPELVVFNPHNQYSELTFYPKPNIAYNATIRVKNILSAVSENDSLTFVPPYYQYFMFLDLAKLLSSMHISGEWTPELEAELTMVKSAITSANKKSSVSPPPNDYPNSYSGRWGWFGYNGY